MDMNAALIDSGSGWLVFSSRARLIVIVLFTVKRLQIRQGTLFFNLSTKFGICPCLFASYFILFACKSLSFEMGFVAFCMGMSLLVSDQ